MTPQEYYKKWAENCKIFENYLPIHSHEDMMRFAIDYHNEQLLLLGVSRSNKEDEDLIIGSITEVAYTVRDNHGFLKIQIPYGYYKIEKWKNGDKVELVITR